MSEPTSFRRKIGGAALMIFGFAVLPFAFIIAPRFVINSFKEGNKVTLSDPDLRHRIKFTKVTSTPAIDRLMEVGETVSRLVDEGDWVQLSDQIEDWDQARTAAPDGSRLAQLSLPLIAGKLAGGQFIDDIPALPDDIVDHLEGIAATHPKRYPLAAICAYLRIEQAWHHRGDDYSDNISDQSWAAVEHKSKRAIWLLEPHDAMALKSPLLAGTRFGLLPFLPDAQSLLHRYYQDWASLDPADQEPHVEYGHMLLPRWYGSFEEIENAAQKAYAATHDVTGAAAYASIYHKAMEYDPELLMQLDSGLFIEAIEALVTHVGTDPAFVATLVQQVHGLTGTPLFSGLDKSQKHRMKATSKTIGDFACHLARTRLTAIHPGSWEDGVDEALDFISADLREEIEAGHHFVMGPNGVEVVEESTDIST